MLLADRIRAIREAKKLSQGDIEKRSRLLRPYLSRIENGHTVPSIETLEKLARALEIPLYQLFYEGEEPPDVPTVAKGRTPEKIAWGSSGKETRMLAQTTKPLKRTLHCSGRIRYSAKETMAFYSRSAKPTIDSKPKILIACANWRSPSQELYWYSARYANP